MDKVGISRVSFLLDNNRPKLHHCSKIYAHTPVIPCEIITFLDVITFVQWVGGLRFENCAIYLYMNTKVEL